jgi:hypothetical protein
VYRELARRRIREDWERLHRPDLSNFDKGGMLEEFLRTLFDVAEGLEIVGKNIRTEDQELDLVLKNGVQRHFRTTLASPLILVECKNWSTPVATAEARVFERKLRQAGPRCALGLFLTLHGVTRPFLGHLNAIRRDGIYGIVITGEQIGQLLLSAEFDAVSWLEGLIAEQLAVTSVRVHS